MKECLVKRYFPAVICAEFDSPLDALIALHVLGALKHHFVNRDDVLTRMLARRAD